MFSILIFFRVVQLIICMLSKKDDEKMLATLRINTRTGRPAAGKRFVAELESRLGRRLLAKSVGRPRKAMMQ